MRVPVTTLNDGYDFPLLGLGTYKLQGDEVETVVRTAIELGYRHIDTAKIYDLSLIHISEPTRRS